MAGLGQAVTAAADQTHRRACSLCANLKKSVAQAFLDGVVMSLQLITDRWQSHFGGGVSAQTWVARLPMAAATLLALMAAWLLVRLLWLLVMGPDVVDQSLTATDSARPSQPAPGEFSAAIDWTLFGREESGVNARATRVLTDDGRLSLVGLVYTQGLSSDSKAQSYALIRGAAPTDQIYQVGDTLPDGRLVDTIEPNAVILTGPAGRRALMLNERADGPDINQPASRLSAGAGGDSLEWDQGVGVASLGGLGRSAVSGSFERARQGVAMIQVPSGGFRLRPGPGAQWFVEAGLQINDVLLAINGQPVDAQLQSGTDLSGWIERIAQGERIALTVDRDGQRVTIEPSGAALRRVLESAGG